MRDHKANYDVLHESQTVDVPPPGSVTVAVSLFNYARYVAGCMDSVVAQTLSDVELLVVDDKSMADDSAAVAEAWMCKHSERFGRVTLLRHVRNSGLAEARNTAFRHARTDMVFVMDADNEIYPRCLERLAEFVRHEEYGAAYTQLEFFGDERRLGYADAWSKEQFRSGNYVDAMALVSKRAWRAVGGYRHLEGGWEDYDFWCTFVDKGIRAIFVPEILGRYRVHGNSMLRTETGQVEDRLTVEMCGRHTWLDLGR